MKELQKYYAHDCEIVQIQYTSRHKEVYLASEADAHIDRKLHSLRLKLIDADGENGQLIGALVDAMNHITDLKQQHAEDIERLKAERDARPYTNNDELNLAIRRLREWGQCLSDKLESQPADWEQDSSLETWFPFTAEEIVRLRKQAERYEKLKPLISGKEYRRIGITYSEPRQIDELVDQLPASGEEKKSPRKGDYGQECNRKACKRSPATWHNHGTNRYYCEPCGKLINAHNPEIEPPLCSPAIGEAQKQPKTLLDFGYAPGGYFSTCLTCNAQIQDVDKRCYCCKPCAQAKLDKWNGREAQK